MVILLAECTLLVEAEDAGAEEIFVVGLDAGDIGLEEIVLRLLIVGLCGTSEIESFACRLK